MTAGNETEPRAEDEKAGALQRAAMIAILGRQGIDRASIPQEWIEQYDALHRDSTQRSGEEVYFEGENLRDKRNDNIKKYRTPYWNGVKDGLEASLAFGGGMILRDIATADRGFLIQKLAKAESDLILVGSGLIQSDIRISQDEIEGRIAAFEWALGYRETTNRISDPQAA